MTPTREILWNISDIARITMNVLMVLPFAFLAYGLAGGGRFPESLAMAASIVAMHSS